MHYVYYHFIIGLVIASVFAFAFRSAPPEKQPSAGAKFFGYLLLACAWEVFIPLLLFWPKEKKD